ncbi:MAG TPA: polymer-forming cytoskeletal protein [Steroidobacteraceae bacterium]|nr:polymer-forming cytoskeletal protein [Steroidobacteraceae bacterium]
MFKRNSSADGVRGEIDTLIGRTTRINGDVTFSGGFHLDGHVSGNVRAESGTTSVLSVSEHGSIEGSVEVPHVVLNGAVKGDILAHERVELGAKARVNGNVCYGVIEMAMGASINGKLIHDPAAPEHGMDAEPAPVAGT